MGVTSEQDLDLRGMTFLAWTDAAAPGPDSPGRASRRAALAARLAPAIERFAEKYGQPPTVVLVAAVEDTTGVAVPVVVRPGIGRGQFWLGTRLVTAPVAARTGAATQSDGRA